MGPAWATYFYQGPIWDLSGHFCRVLPIWDPFCHACWEGLRLSDVWNLGMGTDGSSGLYTLPVSMYKFELKRQIRRCTKSVVLSIVLNSLNDTN